jgi:hypothetical protein
VLLRRRETRYVLHLKCPKSSEGVSVLQPARPPVCPSRALGAHNARLWVLRVPRLRATSAEMLPKSTAHADGLVELAEAASSVSSSKIIRRTACHFIERRVCTAPTLEGA